MISETSCSGDWIITSEYEFNKHQDSQLKNIYTDTKLMGGIVRTLKNWVDGSGELYNEVLLGASSI